MKFLVPEEHKHSSGIYVIRVEGSESGSVYVGSAVNFYKRFYQHRWNLRRGKHHCKHLQRVFDKYSEKFIIFEMVEKCQISDLMKREQHYLDSYEVLYNSSKTAFSLLGFKHSNESKLKKHMTSTTSNIAGVVKKNNSWVIVKYLNNKAIYVSSTKNINLAREASNLLSIGISIDKIKLWVKAHETMNTKTIGTYTGVSERSCCSKRPYIAKTMIKGERISIGYFETPEEAAQARYFFLMNKVYGDYDE